ncbi:hypothetical protein [Kribbella sp. DT2]|uniref:hypothetical protein n=1 Tax=Kribbella sp. DT2 TaxID=3393427 RepID=UPI003CF871BF
MYKTNEELQAAADRIGELQRGILEGRFASPTEAADEIVEKARSILSTYIVLGDLPDDYMYRKYVEPLGIWCMELSMLWMGKEDTPRGAALKTCFDTVSDFVKGFSYLNEG